MSAHRFRGAGIITIGLLAALLTGCTRDAGVGTPVKLATTTSTANTGLLDYLLGHFRQDTGIQVDFIATGTGKAIKHGENGDVDVILVHAPAAEEAFVQSGHGIERVPVMWNDFVILGPAPDELDLARCENAAAALARIRTQGADFISRGDDSGTHKKEKSLWRAATVTPSGAWYIEAGQGMGACLAMADDKRAYVLTDRGTFLSMTDKLQLRVAYEGDPLLRNPYAVIAVNPEKHPDTNRAGAQQLIEWLTAPRAQRLIESYRVNGHQLFKLFD